MVGLSLSVTLTFTTNIFGWDLKYVKENCKSKMLILLCCSWLILLFAICILASRAGTDVQLTWWIYHCHLNWLIFIYLNEYIASSLTSQSMAKLISKDWGETDNRCLRTHQNKWQQKKKHPYTSCHGTHTKVTLDWLFSHFGSISLDLSMMNLSKLYL